MGSIRTKPVPFCPDCGAMMILRRPKKERDDWETFWGCRRYPECKGSRNILPNGKPEMDDDEEQWAEFLDE